MTWKNTGRHGRGGGGRRCRDGRGRRLKAVREAAARGLSSTEATGIIKAALIRLEAMERPKKPRE